ncbi:xanthine dehydrogenase [Aureococcus anophagefferens]|nr:xanthine dehydrogenase [Aureococcus anophagefferens]
MAALAAMAGKLGLDMDDLNDSDRPPPGPPKDPNEPVLAPVMGKSSVEVIEGSDEIRPEGWWHPKGAPSRSRRVGSKRYRFHESIIYEHIVPAKGKVKVKSDHVVVTMFKVHAACPWDTISVNRKAVGPVRTSPPDHGRPTVVTASGDAA